MKHHPLLGRRYSPDPRDADYPLRAALFTARTSRIWNPSRVTDQGTESSCVGHSCFGLLASAPVMQRRDRALPPPDMIYREAQGLDEWPGENYDGTSVRAGMEALRKKGLIFEYRWATSASTLKGFILSRGPVVVGTDWWSSMFDPQWRDDPKRKGLLNEAWLVPGGGEVEGGHAWLVYGYSSQRKAYRMQNSWGVGWGETGRAWIAEGDLHYLVFMANGEAASAVEVAP